MKEYIEREVAKEELLSWARCIKHPEHLLTEDAVCVLDSIPAADVVEVVHSHWVHDYSNVFKCFTCLGKECMAPYNLRPYCPNCGARMDGE